MAAVFSIVLLALFNVPFNLAGVVEHLRVIVGPGSQPYRMYPSSFFGYVELVRDSIWQLGNAMMRLRLVLNRRWSFRGSTIRWAK